MKEIRILESGLHTTDLSSHLSVPRTLPATAAFHTGVRGGGRNTTPNVKKKPLCIYSKGEHFPNVCTVVTDYQKRLDVVKRENLCFKYLGKRKISQCNSRFRCKNCNRKHHTSLCKPTSSDATPDSQKKDTEPNSPTTPVLYGSCSVC